MNGHLYLWLIPLAPFAGFLINGLLGGRLPKFLVTAIGLLAPLVAFAVVLNAASNAFGIGSAAIPLPYVETCPVPWINIGTLHVDFSFVLDQLSLVMLLVVTGVGFLIHVYSVGYMAHDEGYARYFSYLNLFLFFMTTLVLAGNALVMFVGWEGVGLASYLLIGFWFSKTTAADAGKKAFIVNRIGDFGFLIGMFLLLANFGTLTFSEIAAKLTANPGWTGGILTVTALCLLLGATGKSAQLPLYVWLPDAMEGPTPVSALIHAATMVTAGVYLVTRCSPLFSLSPTAQTIVAVIGGFTALLAGLIALTQTDLKRVLAYSTVSQLGYMFLSLGTGSLAGIVAGMFHLFTHAFFKALLFLGAGSVMHAMGHVIDMRRFSGLRNVMPWTFRTFWIGSLALAGIVPFAGFWSKDAILAAVHERAHDSTIFTLLYWSAVLTAFMTAFYTFRALFMTFYGPTKVPSEAGEHAHESPSSMTVPLMILAVCAFGVGWYFEHTHGFAEFLVRTPSLAFAPVHGHGLPHEFHMSIAVVSTLVALAGVGLAAFLYLGHRKEVTVLTGIMQSAKLYQLSYGKFFIDQIYALFVVGPLWLLALVCYAIDRYIIDGIVNLGGIVPRAVGSMLRALQAGMIQFYALAMVLGVLVLMGALLLWQIG